MKKILFAILSMTFISQYALAADVTCSCSEENCKDVEINFVPAAPGVYLNVSYNDGAKVSEGFAIVSTFKNADKVVYNLGNFVLVKEKGVYSMPATDRVCK